MAFPDAGLVAVAVAGAVVNRARNPAGVEVSTAGAGSGAVEVSNPHPSTAGAAGVGAISGKPDASAPPGVIKRGVAGSGSGTGMVSRVWRSM
jgi:hypothetical protein